jgi:hypothetical protein
MGIFNQSFRGGFDLPKARYTRSADGRETWTPIQRSAGPRDEMVAKYDGACKLPRCGDRSIVAGVTEIRKVAGQWNHQVCPKAVEVAAKATPEQPQNVEAALEAALALRIADAADRLLEEYEAGASVADRADGLLFEYEAARRVANISKLQAGIYRVEFSGRRNTQALNLKIIADKKVEGAFLFKKRESDERVGRIYPSGQVRVFLNNSALDKNEVGQVQQALDILLGAESMGKYGLAYAREAGVCFRCSRTLTQEDSIDRGLGAHCATLVERDY